MTASVFDVAVIGAGVMGSSTALFLARGGMHCVLIDRAGVCAEASGVNAGTLTMNMTRADLIPYALEGWRMWTQAADWLGSDPGVTATDGLSLAFTDTEADLLTARAAARCARGADIRLIDGNAAQKIEPGLSDQVKLAAYCPVDGHVTANFTGQAYRQALVKSTVTLCEKQTVAKVTAGDGVFRIECSDQLILARRVVLAGGVWLENMLRWFDIEIPVKALVNQLVITERLPSVMRTVLSIANGLLSLKQFANGTVLIGGGWQGHGDRETGTTEIIPENMIGNIRLARFVIPALTEARIVRSWLGFEAETADAMPLIGDVPGVDNAFVIGSVHSGYTSGPYMGKLLADYVLGRELELPLFDPARLVGSARTCEPE